MNGSRVPWTVLEAIREAGGLPLLVGGAVRDLVSRKRPHQTGVRYCFTPDTLKVDVGVDLEGCKDLDFEVYNLSMEALEAVLSAFGTVDVVGKAFGVLKLHGVGHVDFSVPRRDNKVGAGHRGFNMEFDPSMTVEEAARRRDLTINSMALDLFSGELHDPFDGLKDLDAGRLRATHAASFLEDPLRALRVAQFASRFGFEANQELKLLCQRADLSELPGERLFAEFEKLLRGREPGRGLEFLKDCGLLRFFPELDALQGCEQDPVWHPEGDVWTHTRMAVQAARDLLVNEKISAEEDLLVVFAVLCHDLGKPSTTRHEEGHVKSKGHEAAGEKPAEEFLNRLRAPHDLIARVKVLTKRHLAPAHFYGLARARGDKKDVPQAGPGAFRRLAAELGQKGTSPRVLQLVARADHFGRTTPNALARKFEAGDWFLERAAALHVTEGGERDVVQGRHLIARGMKPGPEFGAVLKKCRELQDETGMNNPEAVLTHVLAIQSWVVK